ncbi:MAG: lipoyl(octanoyl) transferase LipB [Gammaproteobacteria bacterium]|jgi:lipoyl(octanoyl) transferase
MKTVYLRHLGREEYGPTYRAMQAFNSGRRQDTMDEIWCLEHQPVYTLGLSGRTEHILSAGDIPVVHADRGGQVTYHGPGQLVVYLLLDLKRRGIGVKRYVHLLEQSVIDLLAGLSISAARRDGAPGVYVDEKKIAALGVRVRGGCCYHGLALNVDMDLAPFSGINPCGYPALEITQIRDYGISLTTREAADRLLPELMKHLEYKTFHIRGTASALSGETAAIT